MKKLTLKKPQKCGELNWVLGAILVALGVCLCKKADLGVSMIAAPAFIIYEAVAPFWSGFSVGMLEYIVQGVLLLVLCAGVQRFDWKYLLAFVTAVLYGFILDFWLWVFGSEPFAELYLRWIMLIVGDAITAAGVACYFRTYMPLQVYELFVAEVADKYRFRIPRVKYAFDFSCLTISLILAFSLFGDVKTFDWSKIYGTSFHNIGLGTLVSTIINAPIIAGWGKLIDTVSGAEPLFPRLYKLLHLRSSAKTAAQKETPTAHEETTQ